MSSVGVLMKKNLSVFVRKKNLCVWRKIFKVWRGEKCKCKISGVQKKEIERKVREKKNQSVLGKKKDFSKFVLTSWALCCKTWQKFEELKLRKNLMKIFKVFFGSGFVPTHVWAPCCEWTLKSKIGCHVVNKSKLA